MKRSKPPHPQHADGRGKSQRAKALDVALLQAAPGGGPFLVRAPTKTSTSSGIPALGKADAKAVTPSNTVLADALRSAGLSSVGSPPTTKRKPTLKLSQPVAGAAEPAEVSLPPTPPPPKKARPEKRRSKAVAVPATKRKKRARIQPAAATVPKSTPSRSPEEKAAAIAIMHDRLRSFIDDIQSVSFHDLLAGWQKHVSLIGYIGTTGRNKDRLPLYQKLIETVESEWQRRGALHREETDYFDWPTTDARSGSAGLGDIEWVPEGVLKYLGYGVGKGSTLTSQSRQAILRRVFQMQLPPFERPSYLREWGEPASAARLRKMAESIASFIRLAKAQARSDKSVSITEWEADLEMLRIEYYVAKFGFGWPAT